MSRAALANIETGRQNVMVHQLYAFAKALKIDVADFLPPPDQTAAGEEWSDVIPSDLKPKQQEQIARLLAGAQAETARDGNPMPPSKENADSTTRVQSLLTRFAIRAAPVPVDRIAKGLGAQLRFSPLDEELSGMIYISATTPIIGVNSLHHPNRQRFTIAHEIGHLELHRSLITGKVHVDKTFPD